LAPRDGEDIARPNNNLDCLTGANAASEVKGLFGLLHNEVHPPPDPESRSPGGTSSLRARENDRLAGAIDKANTAAAEISQERISQAENIEQRICQRCCRPFEPRKGNGGKGQKFCSTACRKAFHANPNAIPNVNDVPNVGGKDVGKSPNVGAQSQTVALGVPDDDEFRWRDEITVVPSQPAIAVYFNPYDDVVIRQETWPDEDRWIYIRRQNLALLIRRLQEIEETGE
jgi:hypothetical protein